MYKIKPSRTLNYMNEQYRAYKTKIESLEEKTFNYKDVVVYSVLMFHHMYVFVNMCVNHVR